MKGTDEGREPIYDALLVGFYFLNQVRRSTCQIVVTKHGIFYFTLIKIELWVD